MDQLPPEPARSTAGEPSAPAPARPHQVHHVSGAKAALLWVLGIVVRAWGRTLRIAVNREELAREARGGEPVVFAFWHNRLFFTPRLLQLFRPKRQVVALVSASRDGAVFSRFVEFLGVRTVRGSSSRLGREAVHGLVNELRAGHDAVVTPDGPRGPMYDMKPGALLAARRARAAIVLVGVECRACWQLRSWDRFKIPRPFARVRMRCERIELAALEQQADPLRYLRARLLAVNGDVEPAPAPAAEARTKAGG